MESFSMCHFLIVEVIFMILSGLEGILIERK